MVEVVAVVADLAAAVEVRGNYYKDFQKKNVLQKEKINKTRYGLYFRKTPANNYCSKTL